MHNIIHILGGGGNIQNMDNVTKGTQSFQFYVKDLGTKLNMNAY